MNNSKGFTGSVKPTSIEQDGFEAAVSAHRMMEVPSPLIQRLDYGANTDGQPDYLGYAPSGLAEGTNGWLLFKFTYDANRQMTAKNVYGAVNGENANWTAHSTYTYH